MTDQHPITPTPDLVSKWASEFYGTTIAPGEAAIDIAIQAARWGADQELLACGKYLERCAAWEEEDVTEMYNYRRPRPLSLKEQALAELAATERCYPADYSTIRRALEQLDD